MSLQSVPLQQRAEELRAGGIFLGGRPKDFEPAGRMHLGALLQEGLYPHSRVLDLGCGVLRSGYWLIHFLNRGCYHGIEPDRRMLEAGIERIVGREVVDEKEASFSHDDSFDLTVFGVKLDFVTARSIWTHAAKHQIARMLDSFREAAGPEGKMLVSYLPAFPIAPASGRAGRFAVIARDYKGTDWIGHSHTQKRGGLVAHSKRWIRSACAARGLEVRQLRHSVMNHQKWLLITRA